MWVGRFSLALLLCLPHSVNAREANFSKKWEYFDNVGCSYIPILRQESEALGDKWTIIKDVEVVSFLKGIYALEYNDYPAGTSVALVQPARDDFWKTDYILFIKGNTSCYSDTFGDAEGRAISAIKNHKY